MKEIKDRWTLEEAKANYDSKRIMNKIKSCDKCKFSKPYGFSYTQCVVKDKIIDFEILNAIACKYYVSE